MKYKCFAFAFAISLLFNPKKLVAKKQEQKKVKAFVSIEIKMIASVGQNYDHKSISH